MITLDRYAHDSKLRGTSPAAKAGFALGGLLACVIAASNTLSIVVFCVMACACIVKSGLNARIFVRLCTVPFWFLLIGALTVAVRWMRLPADGLFVLPLLGHALVLTASGVSLAMTLFLKSMASVACLCFLCVSTTTTELMGLLHRLHCPKLFIELMLLIYRFIFVLLDVASQLSIAQKSRLGNLGYGNAMRSFAILGSGIFIKAFKRSSDILNAMESRGYDGSVDFSAPLAHTCRREWLLLAAWLLLLLGASLACRMFGV